MRNVLSCIFSVKNKIADETINIVMNHSSWYKLTSAFNQLRNISLQKYNNPLEHYLLNIL